MDKITELYARSAYQGRTPRDLLGGMRSAAALAVLILGIAFNVVAPFLVGWWLMSVLGFR